MGTTVGICSVIGFCRMSSFTRLSATGKTPCPQRSLPQYVADGNGGACHGDCLTFLLFQKIRTADSAPAMASRSKPGKLQEKNHVEKIHHRDYGGSQSTKVVMYDLEGNVVCKAKAYYSRCTRQMPILQNILRRFMGIIMFCRSRFDEPVCRNKEDIVGIGLGSIRCCRAL